MNSKPITYDEIVIEASNSNQAKAVLHYDKINKELIDHHVEINTPDGYCWHVPSDMDDSLARFIADTYNNDPNMVVQYERDERDGGWIRFAKYYKSSYDH